MSRRDIRHRLQREHAHDRAAVVSKPTTKRAHDRARLGGGEPQAREHLSDVPAHLLLSCALRQAQELGLVPGEQRGLRSRSFLSGVGATRSHDGIGVRHAVDELPEQCRPARYTARDLIRTADRAEIAAAEFVSDLVGSSHERLWPRNTAGRHRDDPAISLAFERQRSTRAKLESVRFSSSAPLRRRARCPRPSSRYPPSRTSSRREPLRCMDCRWSSSSR